jgi:hypothetical protein
MQATISSTAVSRRQHEFRLAVLFIAVFIGSAAVAAMVFQAYAGPMPISASAFSATAEAKSARLLALDKALFSVVAEPDSSVVRNQRLLELNNGFYPAEAIAVNTSAAQSARLLDLNNRFYPVEAVSANTAAAQSARLLELNNRFAPSDSISSIYRSPRDARLLDLNR